VADSAGFDAFYSARAQRLTRHLYLATGDLARAQECAQEAFLRAWLRWDRLQTDDPVGWVHTVAWRLAVTDWRASVRRQLAMQRHGLPADAPAPSVDVIAVRDALALLSEGQRAVLVLHYFDDQPIAVIARTLGIAEGTVKARLTRGRQAMETLLALPEETTWTT
jgi:RNA polymerase sigma-70 factor (ECF subfamily)